MVTGLVIIPDSLRLTLSTEAAWSSIDMFRWSTPIPPCRAIAIAILVSVTVSMAAESNGAYTLMRLVRRLVVSACEGITSVWAGKSITSSYVRPTNSKGFDSTALPP